MNRTRTFFILAVTVAFVVTAHTALAHPGRTDANGGHTCRTNCTEKWGLKYGEYHYHGIKAKTAKTAAKTTAKSQGKNSSK